MPVTVNYPGVYVEEIPSGVRTITGVPTSITAFLGRAKRGSTNEATVITNFGDFERFFGGLGDTYPMSYAVRDFYLNGGSQALIVRLASETAASASLDAKTAEELSLVASSPGSWGNELRFRIEAVDPASANELVKIYGVPNGTGFFNVLVRDTKTGTTEKIANVTALVGPRRVDLTLKNESSLVRVSPQLDLSKLKLEAHNELKDMPEGKSVWDKDLEGFSTGVNPQRQGNDGGNLDNTAFTGSRDNKTGLYALEKADIFNLLCIPADTRETTLPAGVYQAAMAYCYERRAMLIVDPPVDWNDARKVKLTDLGLTGPEARNAALYFPRVEMSDPLRDGQPASFVPCGMVAGVISRTDAQRGVWKAPAGQDAAMNGVLRLMVSMTDPENGLLNPLGINCLRTFPLVGPVVWGARTLRGADQLADEYKYLPVRRLALYIEESLYRGTKWVVFEPNDEPLWAQIRLNIGAFMHNLFRQGAFQGASARDAYFVKCDKESTSQNDINLGIVNILVGFAPLKPAEFVIIKLQQMAGQIDT